MIDPLHTETSVGRPRRPGSLDLPTNLYYDPKNGRYRYRHPVTGQFHKMGSDKAKAVAAARKLNSILIRDDDLVAEVIAHEKSMAQVCEWFRDVEMPRRKLASATSSDYRNMLATIERDLGHIEARRLCLTDISRFLKQWDLKPRMRNRLRGMLVDLGRCATAEGWQDSNVADCTRVVYESKERARLTQKLYDLVHAEADPWLRAAMDLNLAILSRREDLVLLRFDQNIQNDALHLDLIKSSKEQGGEREATVRIAIQIDETLRALIGACRDDVLSPYIVHCEPKRRKPRSSWPGWRVHHAQVSKDYYTRAFAEARNRAFAKARIEFANPPTVHEIRSLGAARLREAGMPEAQIQALLGHGQLTTTQIYLRGHTPPRTIVSLTITE